MAANPNVTIERVAAKIASGYKASCPQTFGYKPLPPGTLPVENSYTALIGCGRVADAHGDPGAAHSETALIMVIKGSSDLYMLQWAERTNAVNGPPVLDEGKWMHRLKLMEPIKLCMRVEGEKAPYPSCLSQ